MRFAVGDEVFGTGKGSFAEHAPARQDKLVPKPANVTSIGADHVIDYTQDDFADGPQHYDLILDIGGNSSLTRLRRALTPRGTLVIVGGEDSGRWTGLSRQLRALALSPFVRQRLTIRIPKETHRHRTPRRAQ